MHSELENIISEIKGPCREAMEETRKYQAKLAKPPGSLGRLEELSVQIAGITGKVHNHIKKKHLLVFAADNGVVCEGVSSAPQSVTLKQAVNIAEGKTGAAVLAAHSGAEITVCDVGINGDISGTAVLDRKIMHGTNNIAQGPAMTRQQALKAVIAGAELAESTTADIIGAGEMGIGNTTTASAVAAVLLGADAETVTGRGGGITDMAFQNKKSVVKRAIEINRPDKNDVIDVISKVGGLDIAAMCGAFLGAVASGRPAVIDGFVSAAAALCAVRLCPAVWDYLIPSHNSFETGHKLVMKELGMKPMLELDMRLGEGSGCMFAFDIVEAACEVMNHMATFEEAGINDDYLEEIRCGDKFTP